MKTTTGLWPPISVPVGSVALGFQRIVSLPDATPVGAELFTATSTRSGAAWHDATVEELHRSTTAALQAVRASGLGSVTVNVDPRLLHAGDVRLGDVRLGDVTLDDVTLDDAVGEAALDATLTIEVLETAPLSRRAVQRVQRWRTVGAKVVLDDYRGAVDAGRLAEIGTIDGVKLDRTLVIAATGDDAAAAEITALVRRFPIVVAEGVEDAEVAAAMAALGVRLAQGWWFHRPCALIAEVASPSPPRTVRAQVEACT